MKIWILLLCASVLGTDQTKKRLLKGAVCVGCLCFAAGSCYYFLNRSEQENALACSEVSSVTSANSVLVMNVVSCGALAFQNAYSKIAKGISKKWYELRCDKQMCYHGFWEEWQRDQKYAIDPTCRHKRACNQFSAKRPVCENGWCIQTFATEPTCNGGQCSQMASRDPTCKGGKCDQPIAVRPTCSGGNCKQRMSRGVTCDGGNCDQAECYEGVTCDGGNCEQWSLESPTCHGGKCYQTGSKTPTCHGGNCWQTNGILPTCDGGNCDQRSDLNQTHVGLGNVEGSTVNPSCKKGNCDQRDAFKPTCDGGKCDQRGAIEPSCKGGDCKLKDNIQTEASQEKVEEKTQEKRFE